MKNILVLNLWSITPPKSGGQHAIYELCNGLAANNKCTYAYVSLDATHATTSRISPNFITVALPARDYKYWKSRIAAPGIFCKDTLTKLSLRLPFSQQLKRDTIKLIERNDVLVISHPWIWSVIRDLDAIKGKVIVYDSHNVEVELARQNELRQPYKWINVQQVKRIESNLCDNADLILCCTEEDRRQYHLEMNIPLDKMHAGFKGVKYEPYKENKINPPEQRKNAAVFIGSDWAPNNNAASYISEALAPRVPDIELFVGGTCSQYATEYNSNVKKLGFVDDLKILFNQVMFAINPITEGSGINMKMMEYMAAGLPIITTPFGARGISGEARNALIVCDLQDFPKAMSSLMRDHAQWLKMSQAGQIAAEKHFDWPVITKKADHLIDQLIAGTVNAPISRHNAGSHPPAADNKVA
jgi:glycosyltransferase involved in cell wall biosynthesis